MTLDSSNTHSTAHGTKRFLLSKGAYLLKGNSVSGPEKQTGPVVEKYTYHSKSNDRDVPLSWCYLFVHHKKVKAFEERLKKDGLTYFIHTTIKYIHRKGEDDTHFKRVIVQSVSGLIFLRGKPKELQTYINNSFPGQRLCHNCSTGKVAQIPHNQMEPFMRVAKSDPDRIRFLLRPFVFYAQNHSLLRITSGSYAGLEGYVVRIARDRKMVMDVGGMSIAIGGIHAEHFEEVGKNEGSKIERATFYKRNLHERNAFIDRYFHQVKTASDIKAQAENIELLRRQTIADIEADDLSLKEAFDIYYFIIQEIGYYYAPIFSRMQAELAPILVAGMQVLQEMKCCIACLQSEEEQQRCETEYTELVTNYGYLFE